MRIKSSRTAIAASTFVFAALFSFGWSEQGVLAPSIQSAQARVGRPLTPVSVAGVARRHNRRAAYGYGAGAVGLGLGAAALGAAAAFNGAPYYYGGGGYYSGGPYASYPYGGYGTGSYYGAYGSGGYPGGYYGGGYANRSYVTGRPTLLPRYYGGW